jgi:hypothetical protein
VRTPEESRTRNSAIRASGLVLKAKTWLAHVRAPSVHPLRASSDQKTSGNLGEGFSAFVISVDCVSGDWVATGSATLAIICLRLFGVFGRREAAGAFLFLRFLVMPTGTRRNAIRSAALHRRARKSSISR